jgi:hypothetical protein
MSTPTFTVVLSKLDRYLLDFTSLRITPYARKRRNAFLPNMTVHCHPNKFGFPSITCLGYSAFHPSKDPSLGIIAPPESPFVTFERSFLERLIADKASYNAHRLLYELLLSFHDYNRLELELPQGWSNKVLGPSVRSLVALGIVERLKRGRVRYKLNPQEMANRYMRIPAYMIADVLKTGKAVLLFSALVCSSKHKKSGGLWTTVKVSTLAERLGVTERTIYTYKKLLSEAGVTIDEHLHIKFPNFQCEIPDNPLQE